MKSGVYRIVCYETGRSYVGVAMDISKRWIDHRVSLNRPDRPHHSWALQRDWSRYGADAFTFSILEYCEPSCFDEREVHWIKVYDSMVPNGYNIRPGGKSQRGYRHSSESIEKMRAVGHDRFTTEEAREAQRVITLKQIAEGRWGKSTWRTGPDWRKARLSRNKFIADNPSAPKEWATKRGPASPELRKQRSEAAKRQHQEGRLGRKKKTT